MLGSEAGSVWRRVRGRPSLESGRSVRRQVQRPRGAWSKAVEVEAGSGTDWKLEMMEWKEGVKDNLKVMVEDTGWIMLPLTKLGAQRIKF